ncbi:hypothetical protein MPSEU_001077100 [Mayamaea pseudoterrestris]|nr:hypothetical protein MPSEU_001077100 [Mayamaea pseudoterrestris]
MMISDCKDRMPALQVRRQYQMSLLLVLLSLSLNHNCHAWSTVSSRRTASTSRLFSISVRGDDGSSSANDMPTASESICASAAVNGDATTITSSSPVTWNWQAVVQNCFASDARPIILFDGVCLFCNAGVDLCLQLDQRETFRFASLQSKVGQSLLMQHGKRPDDLSSIVLVDSATQAYFESDAILRIAKELPGLPGVLRFVSKTSLHLVPTFLRNAAYQVVSNNRYLWGHAEECRLDLDGALARRFVDEPCDDDELRQEASANGAAL